MKDNKVNVDLIVPSLGEKFNVFLPLNKTVGEIILILTNILNELTGEFPSNNSLSIFDVTGNRIYNFEDELINTGIKNGSILALI